MLGERRSRRSSPRTRRLLAATAIVALIGALLAARGIRNERRVRRTDTGGAAFALLTAFLSAVEPSSTGYPSGYDPTVGH